MNLPAVESAGISNAQFLDAIFGSQASLAHVTGFSQDPSNIPSGESGRCWIGGYYKDSQLQPAENQYFTVSLFAPDETGKANRRKANFNACYVIALDDVREKLPIEQVLRLPPPSIKLKSSLQSEQWLYILATPETNADRIDNLHDGLITNGLAPDGKDPGQKGVTRYLRLPEGCNTKAKRIAENGGVAPRCEVTEWHPERRYTLEQLAEPFGVDLDAPRAMKATGAANVSDHPLLNTEAILIKQQTSTGCFDITCPWLHGHTGNDDSGSAMFTNEDGSIGFKCHHGNCEARTGADLLIYIEEQDPGFNDRLKQWQTLRDFSNVADVQSNIDNVALKATDSPVSKLLSMVADGEKLMKQMIDEKYVLKDLAAAGHWTNFYAGPGTGKTLLTLWLLRESIKAGEISGHDVFYLNVDDSGRSGAEKAIMAREFGFHMLLTSVKGFKTGDVLGLIQEMINTGEAKGKVLILDTLKKFTDLMDKRTSSAFGAIAREFVSANGTLITLSHTNKHKIDGKSVAGGTSDIRDDCDACYTIEHVGSLEEFCNTTHTVEFNCTKSRGDNIQKAAFQYTKEKGSGYRALLDSVKRVSRGDVVSVMQATKLGEQMKIDAEIIEYLKAAMTNGQSNKTDIEKFVQSTGGISRNKAREILDRYEGELWLVAKGLKNASVYTLKEATILPVELGVTEVSFIAE